MVAASGWMTAVEGPFRAVARDADGETAHAAGERLYERESERSEASDEPSGRREARAKRAPRTGERRAERAASTDRREGRHASREAGEWRSVEVPVEKPVAGIAYGEATYAVTADGIFLADAGDGWRHRSLGLPDVAGVAVP